MSLLADHTASTDEMNGKSGAILHGGLSVPQQSLRRKTVWTLQIFASVQLAEVFHQDTRVPQACRVSLFFCLPEIGTLRTLGPYHAYLTRVRDTVPGTVLPADLNAALSHERTSHMV